MKKTVVLLIVLLAVFLLCACTDGAVTLAPHETVFIGTGIAVEDAIHDLDKAYGESIAQ